MLHSSFAPYLAQQRIFARVVKLLFALAGCYWIVIYGFQVLDWIDHETLKNLRGGQTLIYFVLLTIWGLEYMRETKRLKLVISASDSLGTPVRDVETRHLASSGSSLTILWPLEHSFKAYSAVLINIGGILLAAILIVARYAAAIRSL